MNYKVVEIKPGNYFIWEVYEVLEDALAERDRLRKKYTPVMFDVVAVII